MNFDLEFFKELKDTFEECVGDCDADWGPDSDTRSSIVGVFSLLNVIQLFGKARNKVH